MKKMMKMVSVVVASALLFSMMSFAVMADTANTEGLIFELDLSEASAGVCEGDTYINGTPLLRTATGQAVEYHTKSDKYLCIGTNTQGTAPFYGDIAEFKVYNTVLSRNDVSNKYIARFGTYNSYKIDSVVPASGSTIEARSGSVVVDFDMPVDESTINDIQFTKEGGLSTIYSVSASSNVVTVNYGKLESGASYTLTVPTTVKSIYGSKLSNPAVYTFTANENYIINEDFTGKTSVPDMTDITYNDQANNVKKIDQTADGDYYLSIKNDTTGDYLVTYTLPRAMGDAGAALRTLGEQHVFEMKFRRVLTPKTEGTNITAAPAGNIFRFDSANEWGMTYVSRGDFYLGNPRYAVLYFFIRIFNSS